MTTETALHYHLQHNHYPPVTTEMIPYCEVAIEAAEEGDWDLGIEIIGDVGHLVVTARDLIDDLHLHGFVEEARA